MGGGEGEVKFVDVVEGGEGEKIKRKEVVGLVEDGGGGGSWGEEGTEGGVKVGDDGREVGEEGERVGDGKISALQKVVAKEAAKPSIVQKEKKREKAMKSWQEGE